LTSRYYEILHYCGARAKKNPLASVLEREGAGKCGRVKNPPTLLV